MDPLSLPSLLFDTHSSQMSPQWGERKSPGSAEVLMLVFQPRGFIYSAFHTKDGFFVHTSVEPHRSISHLNAHFNGAEQKIWEQ